MNYAYVGQGRFPQRQALFIPTLGMASTTRRIRGCIRHASCRAGRRHQLFVFSRCQDANRPLGTNFHVTHFRRTDLFASNARAITTIQRVGRTVLANCNMVMPVAR
jgi:hypothetical protein